MEIMVRTAWETLKKLCPGDFVVCIRKDTEQGKRGKETLIAGVYEEINGERVILYFKNRKLIALVVTKNELDSGVIVGTKDRSFAFRDTILAEFNSYKNLGLSDSFLGDLLLKGIGKTGKRAKAVTARRRTVEKELDESVLSEPPKMVRSNTR